MNLLSKYRTELMGLAIAWTMLYHALVFIPKVLSPLLAFKMLGMIGVDIFFLLSGLGLSYSWKHDPVALNFLKKRFTRILPVFFLFVSLFLVKQCLLSEWSAQDLGAYVGMDFLLAGNLDRWFIPSITLCYLIFVASRPIAQRWGSHALLVMGTLVSWGLSLALADGPWHHLLIFTVRLPEFFLGIHVGDKLTHGSKSPALSSKPLLASLLLLGMAGWLALHLCSNTSLNWRHGLWWYPTVLMVYPLCYFLALGLQWMAPRFTRVHASLKHLGEYSLEIYLAHAFIFSLAPYVPLKDWSLNVGRYPEYLLYSLAAIAMARPIERALRIRLGRNPLLS
jgi:peptidoglycan/LPS O-acetylase OafA/YrhL